MDGKQFDDIVLRVLGDVSRRGVLRAGMGALATAGLAVLGVSPAPDAGAVSRTRKRKRRIRLRQRRKQRKARLAQPPPPPPPPPGICDGKVSCPPHGCCDQCCDPITGTDDVGQCAGPVGQDKCCSVAGGGGFCDVGDECCAPGTIAELGSCGPSGATCCPPGGDGQVNGGWRNPDFDVCCPTGSATFNCPTHIPVCCDQSVVGPDGGCCPDELPVCCAPEDGGGCCDLGTICCTETQGLGCCVTEADCCNDDDDCDDPLAPDCVDGCCGVAPAATVQASRRGRRQQVRPTPAKTGGTRKSPR